MGRRKKGFFMRKSVSLWAFSGVVTILILAFAVTLLRHDFSAAGNERCHRIGAVYMTMNNPFYTVIDNRLLLKADSMGDILLTRNPELNQERQNRQIHDLLQEGIDVLVVNPVDWEGVRPALEEALAANVPVIVVDAPVRSSNYAVCSIYSDNYDAGVQCAKDLMSRKEWATIFLLEHSAAKSAMDRVQGFLDTLAGHPEYMVVGRADCLGQLEIAMPRTEEFFADHGSVDAIFALNDPSALGALEALESKGILGNTLVYGIDGTPEAKSLVADGVMTATAAQSVYMMGDILGDAVYRVLTGAEVEPEIIVPVRLVTAENVQQYNPDGWQ